MSVFTSVDQGALEAWLAGHAVGRLTHYAGIAAGVQNTNYFVDTDGGRYVLTLFEHADTSALPFYLGLMAHLAAAGIACPAPVPDRSGALASPLCGKPAVLVSRLAGAPVMQPAPAHCAAIGDWLAQMHAAAQSYGAALDNPCGAAWRQAAAQRVLPLLPAADARVLRDEIARHTAAAAAYAALPQGIVHADLFRDNALFAAPETARLGGVIDFYFAGRDCLLLDLAITVNDWCLGAYGLLDPARVAALLAAYDRRRPLTAAEAAAWPELLRLAALRFWLSRLVDLLLPRDGALVSVKDPEEYGGLLRRHAAAAGQPWLPA